MSDHSFIIYIDRLKGGVIQKIDAILSPDFFELKEKDLVFSDPVQASGEVYLAEDELVLHLTASTTARMACSVCNRMVSVPLAIKGYYHTEPLNDIKSSLFDYRPVLREVLLLELPKVTECLGGCSERETIAPYLRKESSSKNDPENYYPFTDLKLP